MVNVEGRADHRLKPRLPRIARPVTALLLAAVVLAGCSSTPTTGTFTVLLYLDCAPTNCPLTPTTGKVTIQRVASGQNAVQTLTVGPSGRIEVSLAPGRWAIGGFVPRYTDAHGHERRCTGATASVRSGHDPPFRVICHFL
jgi:hypothetical protein